MRKKCILLSKLPYFLNFTYQDSKGFESCSKLLTSYEEERGCHLFSAFCATCSVKFPQSQYAMENNGTADRKIGKIPRIICQENN